jgi:signal transduction histidine kinase
MNDQPAQLSREELRRRRHDLAQGLSRVNSAAIAIILVVLAFAVAAVVLAYRANRETRRALEANKRAEGELWKSYLAQATAGRLSGRIGRRTAGQQVLRAAAQMGPSLELRNEWIAHSVLLDIEPAGKYHPIENKIALVFDSDLERYVFSRGDGILHFCRTADETELFQCECEKGRTSFMFFSPDGNHLALTSQKGELLIFSISAKKVVWKLPRLNAIDFSPDGKILAATEGGKIRLFETASGQPLPSELSIDAKIVDIAFQPGEKNIAVRLSTSIQLWNWQDGKLLGTHDHGTEITAMGISSRYVAAGDGDGEIQIWNWKTKSSQRFRGHRSLVDSLLFNHRGDLLASGSYDGFCSFWNPQTGRLVLSTSTGFPSSFSRDDLRVAYAIKSGNGGWGIWRVQPAAGLQVLNCADGSAANVWHADFSPDDNNLAVIKGDGLRTYDWRTGEQKLRVPMQRARSAYFSPDGKTLLTCGDNRLSLWPVQYQEGIGIAALGTPKHIPLPKTQHVDSGTVSLDWKKVVLPVSDTDEAVIDLTNPDRPLLLQGTPNPKLPAISPDLKWIVTGTFHGRGSTVWNANTGKQVLELAKGNASAFFNPDGKSLVLAGDKEYLVFEAETWKLLHRVPSESTMDLSNYAAYTRDGRYLAIMKQRQEIALLDAHSCKPIATLTSPEPQTITWLTFNRAGTMLAVTTAADQVQIWDLKQLRQDLATVGLNWDDENKNDVIESPKLLAAAPSFAGESRQLIFFAIAGVVLAILCAASVLRRQRQLIGRYLEMDGLIERRTRELELAQAEIMHSQKMKALGTLAAGIGHDFNNLLSVIRMSAKLIAREAGSNAEIKENVAELEKAVEQGKGVVRSMLGYSRESSANNGAVSLPDIVEDTVGLLSREFLSGITLNLELDRDMPAVEVNRGKVEQILLNLIVNASEAMKGRGTLHISLRAAMDGKQLFVLQPRHGDTYVELVVADSGPGIDGEVLPHIFEPFFTTKNLGPSRGTGLGLSMVYTMAESEGLGIKVQTIPGKGTSFHIIIPAKPADAARPDCASFAQCETSSAPDTLQPS